MRCQGTSDLAIGDLKFSGNSARCRRRWLLYHGTLLYDFPLSLVAQCLQDAAADAVLSRRPPARRVFDEPAASGPDDSSRGDRRLRAAGAAWPLAAAAHGPPGGRKVQPRIVERGAYRIFTTNKLAEDDAIVTIEHYHLGAESILAERWKRRRKRRWGKTVYEPAPSSFHLLFLHLPFPRWPRARPVFDEPAASRPVFDETAISEQQWGADVAGAGGERRVVLKTERILTSTSALSRWELGFSRHRDFPDIGKNPMAFPDWTGTMAPAGFLVVPYRT